MTDLTNEVPVTSDSVAKPLPGWRYLYYVACFIGGYTMIPVAGLLWAGFRKDRIQSQIHKMGLVLAVLSSVLITVVLIRVGLAATHAVNSAGNKPDTATTQTPPTAQPSATIPGVIPNETTGPGDPVNTTSPCPTVVDSKLEALPTLTNAQLGKLLPQLVAAQATGIATRNLACLKLVYADQASIDSSLTISSEVHVFQGDLNAMDVDPDKKGFQTDDNAPYKGQVVLVNTNLTTTYSGSPSGESVTYRVSVRHAGMRWVITSIATT